MNLTKFIGYLQSNGEMLDHAGSALLVGEKESDRWVFETDETIKYDNHKMHQYDPDYTKAEDYCHTRPKLAVIKMKRNVEGNKLNYEIESIWIECLASQYGDIVYRCLDDWMTPVTEEYLYGI